MNNNQTIEKLLNYRPNDALKIALFGDKMTMKEIDSLDLSGLTEIKYSKGGIFEFDVIDKTKLLAAYNPYAQEDDKGDLLAAIERSAIRLFNDPE